LRFTIIKAIKVNRYGLVIL